MRNVKRLYTRRARALRRAAVALALLLFCNVVLHIGYLLPIQAIRLAEESEGVYEPTRAVMNQWRPNMMHLTDCLYLNEGEHSLSLGCTHLTPLGWDDSFVWPGDAFDGGDVQAGVVDMSRKGHERLLVFYGRVRGTEDVTLTANAVRRDWDDAAQTERIRVYGHGVGEEDCLVRGGYTYFIFVEPDPVMEKLQQFPTSYQLVVNRGEEHFSCDIERTASVLWG